MAKGRPRADKVGTKKILREYKKIAKQHGLRFAGMDGTTHYVFVGDGCVVHAPGTPVSEGSAIKFFRHKCRKATEGRDERRGS